MDVTIETPVALPARVRAVREHAATISLAGPLAAQLYGPVVVPCYVPVSDDERAAQGSARSLSGEGGPG